MSAQAAEQQGSDRPELDLPTLARNLRAEGMTRMQIARSLAVSTWRVTELLAGEPARHPGLRARAKDDLHERARTLRADGKTYDEIVAELGVSKASVSLWTRDLPKPPPRERNTYDFERVSAARRAQWEPFLAEREKERQEIKAKAAASVPELDDHMLLMLGAVLYWAEGVKDKPWDRKESLSFINSDPMSSAST
jgi:DNA-binding CsgD family transcriptional regulator